MFSDASPGSIVCTAHLRLAISLEMSNGVRNATLLRSLSAVGVLSVSGPFALTADDGFYGIS